MLFTVSRNADMYIGNKKIATLTTTLTKYSFTLDFKTLTMSAYDADGNLLYTYGDILNMVFRVDALDRCMGADMPVHIARKKIPYVDADGTSHAPDSPNGFKFEQFLFDAFRYMSSVFLFEVERQKEFAPIKNLTGADSVESARQMLLNNGVKL